MTMIERVAYALAVANERKASVQELAIAAIAAMRDPTEEMINAGYTLCVSSDNMNKIYQAMIDAALKE